jgi:hypothetical protein
VNTFIPTDKAGTETFTEYGIAYDKGEALSVPRSTWTYDPAEVARDRVSREAIHGNDKDRAQLGTLRLVKRTVTYTATDWEDAPLAEVDAEANAVRVND